MSDATASTKPAGEKKPRPETAGTEKKPRPEATGGERKPRPEGERKPRPEGEKKPRPEGERNREGGTGGRGGYRGRPQRKDENGNPIPEEHKEGEEKGERKRREGGENRRTKRENQRKNFLTKEQITLETEIPPLPKKSDRLQEPDEKKFKETLEDIDKQIDEIHQKRRNYLNNINKTIKENKESRQNLPLYDVFAAKKSERNQVGDELKRLRDEHDKLKKSLETCFDEQQKYRQKMKKVMKKEDIEKELKHLQDLQSKGHVANLQEEKRIIAEINSLEKSLPFAGPLEELMKQQDEIKAQKKIVGEKLGDVIKKFEKAKSELDELGNDLKRMKQEKTDDNKNLEPVVENKKQEFQTTIEELKSKKRQLHDKQSEDWDKYLEQQDLIKHVEWLTKIKNRLIKDEERKKNDELYKKQEEEQKKEADSFHPFQTEIEYCNLLIEYCNKLNYKKEAEVTLKIDPTADIEKTLQSNEWKKEKIEIVKGKKDIDNDLFAAKKQKGQKKPVQQSADAGPQSLPLQHQIEIIGFFDVLKVPPPLTSLKVGESLKLLKEKLEYFNNLKPEDKKPEDQAKQKEHGSQKQEQKKNPKFTELSENDFPTMG